MAQRGGALWRGVGCFLALVLALALSPAGAVSVSASDSCPPLESPTGPTVTVDTVAELENAASTATAGDTILLAPGVYELHGALWFNNDGVTLRGATGDRADVVLDGGGMLTWSNTHVIAIDADDVTIADLDHPQRRRARRLCTRQRPPHALQPAYRGHRLPVGQGQSFDRARTDV